MKKKISIIIPTRNRINTLKQCLEKINKSTIEIKEIIIIDQSDDPLSFNLINMCLRDDYECIIINQNKPSLTKARNNGIKYATGDILVFMDDDTMINELTLEKVMDTFSQDENIKLVTSIDVNSKIESKYPDIMGICFFRKKITNYKGYVCKGAMLGRYAKNIETIENTQWAMGYFFALSRDIMIKNDIKFDEKLISYAYPEDLDFTYRYCKKIEEIGCKGVINPEIYVEHLGSKEFRIESKKSLSMYVIHRMYLSYKYFKSPIYRIILIWSDIGEVIRRIITKNEYKPLIIAYRECFKNRHDLRKNKINKDLIKLMI